MFRIVVFVVVISVLLFSAVYAKAGQKQFSVPLPAGWKEAARIRLALKGVELPGNVPLKFRVTATAGNGEEIFLGTIGVPAIGPGRSETRRLLLLRMDVTRSLRQLLEGNAAACVDLKIEAVNRRSEPIQGLEWSVETVLFETS
jgi:hypothetical protein